MNAADIFVNVALASPGWCAPRGRPVVGADHDDHVGPGEIVVDRLELIIPRFNEAQVDALVAPTAEELATLRAANEELRQRLAARDGA